MNILKNIERTLQLLSNERYFKNFYFIGGTALNSYLNYRISYDIDFISDSLLDESLLNLLVVNYNAKFIPDKQESIFRINTGEDIKKYKMEFMINGVKLEIFYPNDSLRLNILNKYKTKSNIFLGVNRLPLEAISELKIVALFNRNKIRDLFDVFYMFKYNIIDCETIDRFLSLSYTKTFIEFIDEFEDDGSESLDFEETHEFKFLKEDKLNTLKQLFKEEYIKRCI